MPEGWRVPISEEVKQDWRNDKHHRYLSIKADFNWDGIDDEAILLIRQKGKGIALFTFISEGAQFKTYILDELEDAGWLDVMGINVVEKGIYKTACGKEYFECKPGEPEDLVLKYPCIDYFKVESANSYFYWDQNKYKFNRIWISD